MKWEYKVLNEVDFTNAAFQHLHDLGVDGWELVSVNKKNHCNHAIFKRPFPNQTTAIQDGLKEVAQAIDDLKSFLSSNQ